MSTDLATPLTAKTSASFPLGFVQQDNQYAVKTQNETYVSTDSTSELRRMRSSRRAKAREEMATLAVLQVFLYCLAGDVFQAIQ